MRRLLPLLLLTALACSPSVSGRVYFDADQDGKADAETVGVSGVLIELYEVAEQETKKFKQGGLKPVVKQPVSTSPSAVAKGLFKAADDETKDDDAEAKTPDDTKKDDEEKDADDDKVDTTDTTTAPPTATDAQSTLLDTGPKPSGKLIAGIQTDAKGEFQFNIDPGSYEVVIKLPNDPSRPNYQVTTGEQMVKVDSFLTGATVNFGVYRQGMEVLQEDCDPPSVGKVTTCSLVLRNEAPVPMHNLVVTVQLPKAVAAAPLFDGTYVQGLHQVTWGSYERVDPHGMIKVGFEAQPLPQTTPTLGMLYEWMLDSKEESKELKIKTVSLNITALPDFALQLQGPETLAPGATGEFELTFENTGTMTLATGTLTLPVPEGYRVTTHPLGTVAVQENAESIVWNLTDLVQGAKGARYFSLTAPTLMASSQPTHFKAKLTGSGLTTAISSNTHLVQVPKNVTVSLTVTATPLSGKLGAVTYTWTAVVTNSGSVAIENVTLTATFDDDLILVTSDAGEVTAQKATWHFSTLAAGALQTTIIAKPNPNLIAEISILTMAFELTSDQLPAITRTYDVQATKQ